MGEVVRPIYPRDMATASLPGLSRWVVLHENRPPGVLHVLFWGNMAVTFAMFGVVAWEEGGDLLTQGPAVIGIVVTSTLTALACCLLWPMLAWSPTSPTWRRAASAAFLVSAILCTMTSNATMFLLVCLATFNALAVFGLPGALSYAISLTLFSLGLGMAVPEAPLWTGFYLAFSMLFLVVASGVAFIALTVAAQRAERTSELLTELERAHEDLRHQNLRVREMTVSEERARMSREMHDSTGHYLTALTMNLSNALRFRTRRPEAAWSEVEQARELAREALTDTRRWVRALRPLRLEGRAGLNAMRAMAESFDGGGIHVSFTDSGTWPELSQEAELVCYRALQEGLTNAMRHSGSDRVGVTVTAEVDMVTVTVSDNGCGAPDETVRGGFGLRGLAERVEAIGGSMHTENLTEGGFRLQVEVRPGDRACIGPPAKEGST